jgi:predicted metal-dependent enzyme (double-stranded beta helix superfamily)
MVRHHASQTFIPGLRPGSLPPLTPRAPTLPELLAAIDGMVRTGRSDLDRALADLLASAVAEPDLLHGRCCAPDPERYARHLLHGGPGFSVLAIVWQPGQMSPVHSHRTWCALGVHRGTLTETLFHPTAEHGLHPVGCRQLHPGATSHSPATAAASHRVANLGTETAVSIHAYGAPFERLGQDVNRVWAA